MCVRSREGLCYRSSTSLDNIKLRNVALIMKSHFIDWFMSVALRYLLFLSKFKHHNTSELTWLRMVSNFTYWLGEVHLTRGKTCKIKDSDVPIKIWVRKNKQIYVWVKLVWARERETHTCCHVMSVYSDHCLWSCERIRWNLYLY